MEGIKKRINERLNELEALKEKLKSDYDQIIEKYSHENIMLWESKDRSYGNKIMKEYTSTESTIEANLEILKHI